MRIPRGGFAGASCAGLAWAAAGPRLGSRSLQDDTGEESAYTMSEVEPVLTADTCAAANAFGEGLEAGYRIGWRDSLAPGWWHYEEMYYEGVNGADAETAMMLKESLRAEQAKFGKKNVQFLDQGVEQYITREQRDQFHEKKDQVTTESGKQVSDEADSDIESVQGERNDGSEKNETAMSEGDVLALDTNQHEYGNDEGTEEEMQGMHLFGDTVNPTESQAEVDVHVEYEAMQNTREATVKASEEDEEFTLRFTISSTKKVAVLDYCDVEAEVNTYMHPGTIFSVDGAWVDELDGRSYLRLTDGSGWVPTHSRKDQTRRVVTEMVNTDTSADIENDCEEGCKDRHEKDEMRPGEGDKERMEKDMSSGLGPRRDS